MRIFFHILSDISFSKRFQKGDDERSDGFLNFFPTSIEEPYGFRQRSYCRLGSDIAAEFQNLEILAEAERQTTPFCISS